MSESAIAIQPEKTEQEIIDALGDFANASFQVVGVNHTHKTITFLTGLVNESPDIYRKIFHPKTMKKLQELGERASGGKIGSMEMIGIVGELMQVFK